MNKNILKQVSMLSIFLGAVLGVITTIPLIGEIAFWILMCVSAVIVILFMTKLDMLKINSVQESAVLGAIIGFISFIGFSIVYIPIIIVLAGFLQIYPNYGVSMALSNASIGLIVVLVIFMGVLSGTINAFSGFLTYYGIDFFQILNKNDDKEEHFRLR